MPLTVVGTGTIAVPSVQSDEYIALMIDWDALRSAPPVYFRAQGRDGGDIEIKIDPDTGHIVGIVVIETPSRSTSPPEDVAIIQHADSGSVIVDVSNWPIDSPAVKRLQPAVYEECVLGASYDEFQDYYTLSLQEPSRWVKSNNVALGIAADETLSAILLTHEDVGCQSDE